MSLLGIVIAFIFGFSFLNFFIGKFSFLEILGLSFPAGLGIITILMFLLDVAGINLSAKNLLIVIIASIVLLNYRVFIKPGEIISEIKSIKLKSFFFVGKFNLVWFLLSVAVILVLIGISIKSLFWPTAASDSLSSFDLYGRIIAIEGKMLNSLIYEKSVGWGAAYPPLYALGLAYSYIFGFEMSKIIPTLFFISFAISFYALLIKNGSSIGAIIATFFMVLSPELLGQSAINTPSVPQAMYGSLGIIAIFTWHQTKENKYLLLSVLLLALNAWIRSEGIVYIGAAFLFYAYIQIPKKEFLKPLLFLVATLLPFIAWQVFLKVHSDLMHQFVQAEIMLKPRIDTEYLSQIYKWTKTNFFHNIYFGITIYAFFGAIFINLIAVYKKKDSLVKLALVLIPLFAYLLLLNQLKLNADTIAGIMRSSSKRFFFGIVALMWFYIVQVNPIKNFFIYLDVFLSTPIKPKQQ